MSAGIETSARHRRAGRGARRALVAIVVVLTVLALDAAAGAAPGYALGGATESSQSGSGAVQQVRKCLLYANTAGFGAWCGSGVYGLGHTWRQLLHGHPFVACRDDLVPDGVRTPPDPPGAPGAWWLETCLVDVNLDRAHGGRAHPETTLVWIRDGERVLRDIPPWMTWLWDVFSTAYPTPVLSVGPTARPRVNVPAYFWLSGPAATTIARPVYDGVEWITMQARLRRLQVDPGVAGGVPAIDCGAGTLGYDRLSGPFSQPSRCTYTYPRSSASLVPRYAYTVRADAYWEVGYVDAAGRWHSLGTFDVGCIQLLPVQEVESVGVSGVLA